MALRAFVMSFATARHPLFSSTDAAWAARPSDPNDVFLAQVLQPGPPRADAPPAIGLFGVPFDGAVMGRPGARGGPDAIRGELARLKPWSLAGGEWSRTVYDWGNVRLPHGSVAEVHEVVESAGIALREAGHFPVALGGDHSLTFPLVKALEGRYGRLGVVNLDAHLDVRDVHGGALNSGQSFGRLVDLGLVPGANLVEVGIRDFANASRYADKARKLGATIISAREWREGGLGVIERAVEVASDGVDAVYLSVDVDVLDQAHAPGVSAPTPGGVDSSELFAAIGLVASRARLAGADFVEVAPSLDRDGVTSRAAAFAVMHLLAGLR